MVSWNLANIVAENGFKADGIKFSNIILMNDGL